MFRQRMWIYYTFILIIIIRKLFAELEMEIYLVEECPNNTVVADFSNHFMSTSSSVNEIFRLLDQNKLFYIEEKYNKLRTKHRIDREALCTKIDIVSNCTITLLLLYQSNKMIIKPVIHILDINDNAPTWNKPNNQINLQIPEHSAINSTFRLPEAVDLDKGPHNTTKYYTLSTNKEGQIKFDIRTSWKTSQNSKNRAELSLVIIGDLDRENRSHYQVVITAFDGGFPPLSGELKVDIEITDINDHPPRFKNISPIKLELFENTLLYTVVAVFEADDIDSSDLDHLHFSFLSTADDEVMQTFWLKERSGELVLQKSLDYETKTSYIFFVQVSDGKYSSSLNVEVKILNVNDNAPNISVQPFNEFDILSVPENSEIGQHVGAVIVTDSDDKSGLNPVFCVLNNPILELSTLYDNAKNKFLLRTTKVFDREKSSHHSFTITCSDSDEPVKRTSVTHRLHIVDVNDNLPTFLNVPMKASIKENMPIGTFIYQLRAHDEDTFINTNFQFILKPVSDSYFTIDVESGQIFSKVVFNAEERSKYEISVYVLDKLDGSANKTLGSVDLTIEDVNDNPPIFNRDIYHFEIIENVKTGTIIDKVEAEDADISELHRSIKYYFKHGTDANVNKHIGITHNGKIYVKSSHLDREEIASFSFHVIATDNSSPVLTAFTYVQIEVKDVNDNSPEWIYPDPLSNDINITYHMPVGHEITKFVAKDADQGVNSELEYFIAQMIFGNGIFQIQSRTGVLFVSRILTVQDIRTYRMVIGVKDLGLPSLSKLRSFKINIVHQLYETRGDALFGKFEGDLLVILVLVIVTLIICLGLISAIWFLKCGFHFSHLCQGGLFKTQEYLTTTDAQSNLPRHKIIPVYMNSRQDSFFSNIKKSASLEKMKIDKMENDNLEFPISGPHPLNINSKTISSYDHLQQMKEFEPCLHNINDRIPHNSFNSTIRKNPNCQTSSVTPTHSHENEINTIYKSQTLPKNISVFSNSQMSVKWLDEQCQQKDEEYQICISNVFAPKMPIIKVHRTFKQNSDLSSSSLKNLEYTQLSPTTFLDKNNDSKLPISDL